LNTISSHSVVLSRFPNVLEQRQNSEKDRINSHDCAFKYEQVITL
jgi:hypothetical protein